MRQVVAYRGLKIIKRQAQKVVSVAYRECSFAGGSNCKALAKKSLVFWIGGRLLEVVAYKRWSHMQPDCIWIPTKISFPPRIISA